MKQPCAGQRASISSSSAPIDKGPFTITFITTPPPRTVPGNSITLSAPAFAVRRLSDRVCIEHELSVIQNRSSTARAVFSTMDSGSVKSHPRPNSGCGWGSWRLWSKARRLPGVSAAHGGPAFKVKHGRGWRDLVPGPGRDKYAAGFYPGPRF